MGKVWVLDTDTKGTGARMVPLEHVLTQPATKTRRRRRLRPDRTPEQTAAPEPRRPLRFKVVDVMTREVMAEDATARELVELLEGIRSVVDVRVYVREQGSEAWRPLLLAEQQAVWGFRGDGGG